MLSPKNKIVLGADAAMDGPVNRKRPSTRAISFNLGVSCVRFIKILK
jgi:hypothetical protein